MNDVIDGPMVGVILDGWAASGYDLVMTFLQKQVMCNILIISNYNGIRKAGQVIKVQDTRTKIITLPIYVRKLYMYAC